MEVSGPALDVAGEIDAGNDVDGQPLAGLFDQRDVELAHDLATATIAAEEIFGSN